MEKLSRMSSSPSLLNILLRDSRQQRLLRCDARSSEYESSLRVLSLLFWIDFELPSRFTLDLAKYLHAQCWASC